MANINDNVAKTMHDTATDECEPFLFQYETRCIKLRFLSPSRTLLQSLCEQVSLPKRYKCKLVYLQNGWPSRVKFTQ
jgi:hypothetical protein